MLASTGLATAKRPQVIKQFPLDERTVYEIPIGPDVPTTLMFPSALTAIEGANVSADPETPAPVLLAYTPGRYFFSVRAADPEAKAAVNVVSMARSDTERSSHRLTSGLEVSSTQRASCACVRAAVLASSAAP